MNLHTCSSVSPLLRCQPTRDCYMGTNPIKKHREVEGREVLGNTGLSNLCFHRQTFQPTSDEEN